MIKQSIIELFKEHKGKFSDKWEIYLPLYEELFSEYEDKPIRLLEIGVQNGGSLEIWAKYFSNATRLIGCDINTDCSKLVYDDPRIKLVIGNASSNDTYKKIVDQSKQFDIVIDDGSHFSSDIIQSFALYFPVLANNGLYIIEDLHCSYWTSFEGGLFEPYSSISFFKRLIDVINHKHWGISKARTDILNDFFLKYHCTLDDELLSQIHSIEFINSVCVIRKALASENVLGKRCVFGTTALNLQEGFDCTSQLEHMADESAHITWDKMAPILVNAKYAITMSERDEPFSALMQLISDQSYQISQYQKIIECYKQSTSWRMTTLFRVMGQHLKRLKPMLGLIQLGWRQRSKLKVRFIIRGLLKTEHYVRLFQNDAYLNQIVRTHNVPRELLQVLVKCGHHILIIKRWWMSNTSRSNLNKHIITFLSGHLKPHQPEDLKNIIVHVDRPSKILNCIDHTFITSGWAVNLEANTSSQVKIRIGKKEYHYHYKPRSDVKQQLRLDELPVDVGFCAIPNLSIGIHRMVIEVINADNRWIPVQRSYLLHLPSSLQRLKSRTQSYKKWTQIENKRFAHNLSEIEQHMAIMVYKPRFTIIVDVRQKTSHLSKTLQSIRSQIYKHFECIILEGDDAPRRKLTEELKSVKQLSSEHFNDYIIWLEAGECLHRKTLYEFANVLNQDSDIDLIYGDEDLIGSRGNRSKPFYKPDWSPDYLETFNYIGFPACFRSSIARECLTDLNLYDLVLNFTEKTNHIYHIDCIIGHTCHAAPNPKVLSYQSKSNIAALQKRLERTHRIGSVSEHPNHAGCYTIQLQLQRKPLVSIVIPTAGKTIEVEYRSINMITNLIEQIMTLSTYGLYEIIVVDNGDLSEEQLTILTKYDCRRVTYSDSIFNISKKLNLGASIAKGELLLLMNDDIEILSPDWIERMVEHFEKDHVGVVGAKLLYPNGAIQHAGVVHNFGNPDHVRRYAQREESGYFFSTCGVRNYVAVTGAVMMTLTSLYRRVGGYTEALAVSYNDIDYCLKVSELGYFTVYAPNVELTHMESQSREPTLDKAECDYYQNRWASKTTIDQYYNERFLTVACPTFTPCINQREI